MLDQQLRYEKILGAGPDIILIRILRKGVLTPKRRVDTEKVC
jgi:hypothetical protein